jgi:hypothetical protein
MGLFILGIFLGVADLTVISYQLSVKSLGLSLSPIGGKR